MIDIMDLFYKLKDISPQYKTLLIINLGDDFLPTLKAIKAISKENIEIKTILVGNVAEVKVIETDRYLDGTKPEKDIYIVDFLLTNQQIRKAP